MRNAWAGGWLLAALALSACVSLADPWEHGRALELAQKRYTEAIRWGDLERAARYVDPSLRADFLALTPSFESVRITDYEIGELDVDTDGFESAEVDVTYHGYAMPHYLERRVSDHQTWYRDTEGGEGWRIRPELAALLEGLGARGPR